MPPQYLFNIFLGRLFLAVPIWDQNFNFSWEVHWKLKRAQVNKGDALHTRIHKHMKNKYDFNKIKQQERFPGIGPWKRNRPQGYFFATPPMKNANFASWTQSFTCNLSSSAICPQTCNLSSPATREELIYSSSPLWTYFTELPCCMFKKCVRVAYFEHVVCGDGWVAVDGWTGACLDVWTAGCLKTCVRDCLFSTSLGRILVVSWSLPSVYIQGHWNSSVK